MQSLDLDIYMYYPALYQIIVKWRSSRCARWMHCSRLDWNEYLDWHWDTLKLSESQYDSVTKIRDKECIPPKTQLAAAAAKLLQLCPTLCDPIDGSPPGFPTPGILQARILEWVAISFSSAWKWKVKVKSLSRVQLLATAWTAAYQAPLSMDFPGKSTGVGCDCLLQDAA